MQANIIHQRQMEKQTFVFGTAATGRNFTDRKRETQRLCANFTYGVNTILISPRRWGKTSLVKKVIETVDKDKVKPVYIDIFSCRDAGEFYARFAESVVRQTATKNEEWIENIRKFLQRFRPKLKFSTGGEVEFSLTFEVTPKEEDAESILSLPEKIAEKRGCRIVVCIDEFQQIGEFPDSLTFQKRLRTVWQHQQLTSYCLFGSKRHLMTELFEKSSHPFYKFGDVIFLKKIDTADWVEYIRSRFAETGKEIGEELATEICERVDNQSNYVQQLAWILWIGTKHVARREDLDEAFQELTDHNSMLFESETESLTAPQLNFLRAILEGVDREFTRKEVLNNYQLGTAANIKRIKDSLLKKNLIDIEGGRTYIPDPVLRHWLTRKLNL